VAGGGYNAGQDGHGPKDVDLARTPRQALYVGEARVLWAGANEFGLELRHMDVEDQQWLLSFFIECGHSFRWLDVRNPQLQGIANGQCFEEVHDASIFVGKDASSDERSRLNNHVP
jgi:hypothetical protein